MKIAGAALLALVLTGCGGGSAATTPSIAPSVSVDTTFNVYGQITVNGGLILSDTVCTSDTGYDDVVAGTQVVVKDATGTQVALGRLDPGVPTPESDENFVVCVYKFTVPNVPEGSALYTVEVGSRGGQTYSRDELRGTVELTLG